MHNILWHLFEFSAGCVCGGIAVQFAFLRGYGNAFSEGYNAGRRMGHAEGFAQGRQVAEKAAR